MSTYLFILTPFCFFCVENGHVLGIICLILAIIVKCGESGLFDSVTNPKTVVSNDVFWEYNFVNHYYGCLNSGAANTVQSSRDHADFVTKCNCGYPVTDEKFEEIAKRNGIITTKEREKIENHLTRIQFAKYHYFMEMLDRYKGKYLESKEIDGFGKEYMSRYNLDFILEKISKKISYNCLYGFGKTRVFTSNEEKRNSLWNETTDEEKIIAKKWVDEYEQIFIKEMTEYTEKKCEKPSVYKHYDGIFRTFDVDAYEMEMGFACKPVYEGAEKKSKIK